MSNSTSSQIIPKAKAVGNYECAHCLKRHPNGWYCRHAIATLKANLKEMNQLELERITSITTLERWISELTSKFAKQRATLEQREGEFAEAIRLMLDGSPKEFRTFLAKHTKVAADQQGDSQQ